MVKSVLFDLFGTLVDYEAGRNFDYFRTYESLVALGARIDHDSFIRLNESVFARLESDSKQSLIEYSMQQGMRELAEQLEIVVSCDDLVSLATISTEEWSSMVVPVLGLKPFLKNLSREYRLGVITNTHFSPMIHRLLAELEISGLFEVVVTSVEHGNPKPHPKIFHDTLSRMKISADQAIYVGDNYHADYLGATAVGLTCYLVGNHARVPLQYQINSVIDLPTHQFKTGE